MIWFIVGFSLASAIAFAAFMWLTFAKRSPIVTIEPWWLGNKERWASLFDVLIEERADE